MASKKPSTPLKFSSPRSAKLEGIAAELARALGRRSTYRATHGMEPCPACWTHRGTTQRLRTEPHHSVKAVWCVVCDACGLYVVL